MINNVSNADEVEMICAVVDRELRVTIQVLSNYKVQFSLILSLCKGTARKDLSEFIDMEWGGRGMLAVSLHFSNIL